MSVPKTLSDTWFTTLCIVHMLIRFYIWFFFQWCTSDPRCNRLQLNDLLVAPMQHCTKFPLLLSNIRKYTRNLTEQELLSELIDKVEFSLSKLSHIELKLFFDASSIRDIKLHICLYHPSHLYTPLRHKAFNQV